jgi:hypothetical protein
MPKINPALEQQFKQAPDQAFDLIVRTLGDVTPHLDWFAGAGFTVKQQFRMSPGVAVSGLGRAALALLEQPWVVSIEADAPVRAI